MPFCCSTHVVMVVCRLLKLLDDHWDAYAPYLAVQPAATAASSAAMTPKPHPSLGLWAAASALALTPGLHQPVGATPIPLAWRATPQTAQPLARSAARTAARITSVQLQPVSSSFARLLSSALLPCTYKGGVCSSTKCGDRCYNRRSSAGDAIVAASTPATGTSGAGAAAGAAGTPLSSTAKQQHRQQHQQHSPRSPDALGSPESPFARQQQQHGWLLLHPVVQQPLQEQQQQQLVLSSQLESFFRGFKLPYLAVDLASAELLELLGVQNTLQVDVVLQVLEQLATGQHEAATAIEGGHSEQVEQLPEQHGGGVATAVGKQQQDRLDGDEVLLTAPRGEPQQQQRQQQCQHECGDPLLNSSEVMSQLYSYLLQQLQLARQQAAAATSSRHKEQHQASYQQLQQKVLSAFQSHRMVWLPDAPHCFLDYTTLQADGRDAVELSDGRRVQPVAGRFYGLQHLCLRDPSGVLEQLTCQQLLAARPVTAAAAAEGRGTGNALSFVRPVLLHYADVSQLFTDWLAIPAPAAAADSAAQGTMGSPATTDSTHCVLPEPGLEHYVAALQLLSAEAAAAAAVDAGNQGLASQGQIQLQQLHTARHQSIWMRVSGAACDLVTNILVSNVLR